LGGFLHVLKSVFNQTGITDHPTPDLGAPLIVLKRLHQNPFERKSASADPRKIRGTCVVSPGSVRNFSSRPSRRGATTQHDTQTGSDPGGDGESSPTTSHTSIHSISQHRSKAFLFIHSDTLARLTVSNQYYLTVLLLVIFWRKLERGLIKCSPPSPPVFKFSIFS
jgi:hypothetical protein